MIAFKKEDIFLITGGSSGIGKATALKLVELGASVVISGRNKERLEEVKNQASNPECVFIDCEFLRTLDRDNILSGYAEMIKHGLISSMEVYTSVMLYDIDTMNYRYLNQLVAQSVSVKEEFVEKDPKEQNIRKALNFGHTVGHAYESLSFRKNAPLLHGHAVAAGIISELYLSHKLCGFPMEKLSQVVYYIKEYYRPFAFTCDDYDALYELMTHDKKNEAGVTNFTLLGGVGDVRINQQVSRAHILESLDFYRESWGG